MKFVFAEERLADQSYLKQRQTKNPILMNNDKNRNIETWKIGISEVNGSHKIGKKLWSTC